MELYGIQWDLKKGPEMKMPLKKNIRRTALNCRECCSRMGDYTDGKLSIDEDILFVSHLRSCSECREEFHNYYNFMTNLYFLNYGYDDRFPASEEVLLTATEEENKRYLKKKKHYVLLLIGFIVVIAIFTVIIIFNRFGGSI